MCRQAAAIALLACAGAAAQDGARGLHFSGHVNSIAVQSRLPTPGAPRYAHDETRLRLEWRGELRPGLALDLQHDSRLLLRDGGETATSERWHRALMTLSRGATDVHVGRQRVAWGTGRFFSPLDALNPLDPVALEPGERRGVDALRIERKLGPLARVGVLHAPPGQGRDASTLAFWHGNRAGFDATVVAGRMHGAAFAGMDTAGQIGGTGLRGEITFTRPRGTRTETRAMLGADYAFANTLTLNGELYVERLPSSLRRHAGAYASYEITPLLKWTNALVLNLRDHGRYFSPRLVYSLRTNVDVTAGAQLFHGGASSELGRLHNLRFVQLQWFF